MKTDFRKQQQKQRKKDFSCLLSTSRGKFNRNDERRLCGLSKVSHVSTHEFQQVSANYQTYSLLSCIHTVSKHLPQQLLWHPTSGVCYPTKTGSNQNIWLSQESIQTKRYVQFEPRNVETQNVRIR